MKSCMAFSGCARPVRPAQRGATALALAALALAAAAGCQSLTRPEHQLTVLLAVYKGPEAAATAAGLAKELTSQGVPDVFVVRGADMASLCVGHYNSWQDKQADEMLRRLRQTRDAAGQYPFAGVMLMPIPEPMPENPWPLENAKGLFTLHVASWEAPGRMDKAQAYGAELRSRGYEAYVYHGPRFSIVTIGAYGCEIFDDPSKIGRPGATPKVVDPKVKDLMENKFPRVRLEGEEAPVIKTDKGPGSVWSQLIQIPGRDLPAVFALARPKVLYRVSLALTSAATGLTEGRARAAGVAQSLEEIPALVTALVRQVTDTLPADRNSRVGVAGVQAADAEGANQKADAAVLNALVPALERAARTKATIIGLEATRQTLDASGRSAAAVLGDPQTVRGAKDLDFVITGSVQTFAR